MDDKDYKKLVEMIDGCINSGSAHINVRVGENDEVKHESVCCTQGGACSAPTLHKGIDDEEENEEED